MSDVPSSAKPTPMVMSRNRRITGKTLIKGNISSGFQLGLRKFIRPHLSYRLGLLWIALDPLLRALVFSFLMLVIRGNSSPESLVIGIFTLQAMNVTFSTSLNIRLAEEPFPLSHTPTFTLIISKITADLATATFLGLSSSLLLVLLVHLPISIIPAMIIACMTLAMIGCGSGLLLSPFVTIAKDLSKIINYVLLLGLFLQCVLYPFSITEGYHRQVLSFMPHTIVVEWCRSIASNTPNPFSFSHSTLVLFLWSFPMLWGFVRFDRYRWRSTTW